MNSKIGNSIRAFGLASFMVALVLIGACTSPPEMNESSEIDAGKDLIDTKKDLDEARKDYLEKYETFRMESNDKIAENEKAIAILKSSKSKNKAAKADLNEWLEVLEGKNESLKAEMNSYQYKEDGNEKWESFKQEFNHDMETLGSALRDLTQNNVK